MIDSRWRWADYKGYQTKYWLCNMPTVSRMQVEPNGETSLSFPSVSAEPTDIVAGEGAHWWRGVQYGQFTFSVSMCQVHVPVDRYLNLKQVPTLLGMKHNRFLKGVYTFPPISTGFKTKHTVCYWAQPSHPWCQWLQELLVLSMKWYSTVIPHLHGTMPAKCIFIVLSSALG